MFVGTYESDAPVGRVLSGWDAEYGGRCPDTATLSAADRHTVRHLSVELFGAIQPMSVQFQECLTCILLMHYNSVVSEYSTNQFIIKINHIAVHICGITLETLEQLSTTILDSFNTANAAYLPRKFSGTDTVGNTPLSHNAVLERSTTVLEALNDKVLHLTTSIAQMQQHHNATMQHLQQQHTQLLIALANNNNNNNHHNVTGTGAATHITLNSVTPQRAINDRIQVRPMGQSTLSGFITGATADTLQPHTPPPIMCPCCSAIHGFIIIC